MNRRHFFQSLATAVAGFTILPPATTYSRIWKATMPVLAPAASTYGAWRFWVWDSTIGKWVDKWADHGKTNPLDPDADIVAARAAFAKHNEPIMAIRTRTYENLGLGVSVAYDAVPITNHCTSTFQTGNDPFSILEQNKSHWRITL